VISRVRTFDHLDHLSDERGLFEHADGTARRLAHGYCTDDNARLLVIAAREPDEGTPGRLGRQALSFCLGSQAPDGRIRNRLDLDGHWTDVPGTADWWGRALWGFGAAATHHDDPAVRAIALGAFETSASCRSPWRRSMAFAALGAADVLSVHRQHVGAHRLMVDAVDRIGAPDPANAASWNWPEPRLTYANAAIPEALIAAGASLGDPRLLDTGLAMLAWLVQLQTRDGHLSVVGVGGRGPDDTEVQFDQQPIEVAAIADACWRAFTLTGDADWSARVVLALEWFEGRNDSDAVMWDSFSGGGYDGLHADGPNTNQGAESTLAFVSTVQRARAARMVTA
jgi:hypothetical protein